MKTRNRHWTSTCARLAVAGLVCGLASGAAQAAWDRIDLIDDGAPAHFATRGVSAADDDGYWAYGTVGAYHSVGHRGVIARYRTDGTTRWLRYIDSVDQVIGVGGGEALSAGTGTTFSADGCRLTRWSAGGDRLWGVDVDAARTCGAIVADGAGGAWATLESYNGDRKAVHILADGVVHDEGAALNAYLGSHFELVADPDGSGLYAVGQRPRGPEAGARIDAAIVAIDRHGQVRWQQQVPAPEAQFDHRYDAAVVGRDGNLYVVGHTSPTNYVRVSSYNRDGLSRFERTLAAEVPFNAPAVAILAADAGVHVIAGDSQRIGNRAATLRIGPTGTVLGSTLYSSLLLAAPLQAATTRDGRRLLFTGISFADVGTFATLYLGDDGTPSRQIGPLGGAPLGVSLLADGSAILAHSADSNLLSGAAALLHFDAAGNALTAPDLEVARAAAFPLGAVFGEDGAAYRVTADADFEDATVEKLGTDGHSAWRARLGMALYGGKVTQSVNAGRVCSAIAASGGLLIDCRDAATGASLFQRRFPGAFSDEHLTRLQVLPGGDVLAWCWISGGGGEHLLRLGSDGTVRMDLRAAEYPNALALAADGSAAIVTAIDYPYHLRIYAPSGELLVDHEVDGPNYQRIESLFDSGDGAFVMTYEMAREDGRSDESFATLFDAHRGVLWTAQLADDLSVIDARFREDRIVLLASGDGADGLSAAAMTLARDDGHVRWLQTFRSQPYGDRKLALDPLTGDVAVAVVHPRQGIRLVSLRGADGSVLGDRIESCGAPPCTLGAFVIDTGQKSRVLASGETPSGARSTLFQLATSLQATAPLRLDQRAIVGAWYPDYASGQGLTFDYITSSGVLFAPWFTYAPQRVDDPSGQKWYSLQGPVTPGAVEADLDILQNRFGRFAEPPITTSRKVGTAHVRFETCDRLALDYAFTLGVEDGARGRMTLTRLTTPPAACVVPGASPTSAKVADAVTADPRLSGSWYLPAQSGQGFTFTFQPGRELFGAWFTYDPEGASNDDEAQQWFTLQGDPDAAPRAPLVATIYQTFGGSFDRDATADTRRVGQATVTVQACDRMTVAYQFDTSDVAGHYAGRTGSLALEKIGGCSP